MIRTRRRARAVATGAVVIVAAAGSANPAFAGPRSGVEWMPSLRVSPGVNVALGDTGPASRASFGVEVDAGALIAPPAFRRDGREMKPGPWVWPMVGYQWIATPGVGHGVSSGLGVGYGTDFFAVFYTPRFVLGGLGSDDGIDPGVRHGPSLQGFWGTLGLELTHGMHFRATTRHDVRAALNVNVAMIVFLIGRWARL
jgi:hypothetical protein